MCFTLTVNETLWLLPYTGLDQSPQTCYNVGMKLVKMTSQWKQWQYGHRVAMRFSSFSNEAQAYEEACRKKFGNRSWFSKDGVWHSWMGKARHCGQNRPFFICFRTEAEATLIMLSTDLAKTR